MKKFLATVSILALTLIAPSVALAGPYQDAYCYPSGSYWTAQRNAYPAYYAANDAYFMANYGPGTYYCS